jgi:hypothetical protein
MELVLLGGVMALIVTGLLAARPEPKPVRIRTRDRRR